MDHMAEPVTLVIDRSAARSPTCSSSASSSCACAAGVELTNGSTTVPAAVLAAASDGSEGTGVAAAPTASAAAPPSFPASAAASARISARSPMAHQRSTHRSSLSTRTGGVSVPRWKSRVAARSSSRASVSEVISSVTLSSRASACARSLRSGPSASRERAAVLVEVGDDEALLELAAQPLLRHRREQRRALHKLLERDTAICVGVEHGKHLPRALRRAGERSLLVEYLDLTLLLDDGRVERGRLAVQIIERLGVCWERSGVREGAHAACESEGVSHEGCGELAELVVRGGGGELVLERVEA
eukprot:scaffold298789_cov23-Tisochrysis_lutea.AAC.2